MYLIQVSERTILHKDKGIKKRATVKSYFPNHVTSQKNEIQEIKCRKSIKTAITTKTKTILTEAT